MLAATLANELTGVTPTMIEAQAINNLTTAYANYCKAAMSNGIPVNPAAITTSQAAMATAMVGISAPNASTTILVNGLRTFWVTIASLLAGSFAGAIAITPPPFASVEAALMSLFPTITAGGDTLEVASQKVAAVIHADTIIGGICTFPGPIVAPIL